MANAGVKVITHDRPTGKSIYSRARPEMANGHTKAITNDRSAQDPERLPSDDMDDPDEVYENPVSKSEKSGLYLARRKVMTIFLHDRIEINTKLFDIL